MQSSINTITTIQNHIATIVLPTLPAPPTSPSPPDAGGAAAEYMAEQAAEQAAQQIRDACAQIRQDDDVRVCIITGAAGGAFWDGAHVGGAGAHVGDAAANSMAAHELDRLRVSGAIAAIEKPTIALINGDAIDQAAEIALACDLRVAAADARLGLTHLSYGAIPWDGGTQRLPRIIGQSRSTEMILTSRIVGAHEAQQIGLVHHAAPPEDAAQYAYALAETIAAHAPIAARYLKETLWSGADMTLAQGLGLEADLTVILQSTTDRAEGIASFLRRSEPHYTGE